MYTMKNTALIISFLFILPCICACGNKVGSLSAFAAGNQQISKFDSITDSHEIAKLQEIATRYNEILHDNEQRKKKLIIISISVISLLILIHSHAYLEYLRRKSIQNKIRLEQIKTIKEEAYRKSNLFITENKKRIEKLEQELRDADHTNTTLKKQLERQKQIMLCINRQTELHLDEQEQAEADLFNSEIYTRFKKEVMVKKTNNDWHALQEAIDRTYKGFTANLCKLHNLSDYELKVCLLIKINVQPQDMAKLTNHTKESITATRRRLYEKVFHEKGSPKLWDEFIHSL